MRVRTPKLNQHDRLQTIYRFALRMLATRCIYISV